MRTCGRFLFRFGNCGPPATQRLPPRCTALLMTLKSVRGSLVLQCPDGSDLGAASP